MSSLDLVYLNQLKRELLAKSAIVAPKSANATINVCFFMRTTAGTANYSRNTIKLNYRLLTANPHHITQTFTHELAHLVAVELYGIKAKGHGVYWQRIMRMFGVEPDRCHKLDTSKLVRKHKTYSAWCNCREHKIKSGRRNKIMRGINFRCLSCKTILSLRRS